MLELRDEDAEEIVDVDVAFGSLVVWTSRYSPYFGGEELRLLRTLGALTGLALDRSRLYAQEREARLALERADELKSNFIALAAHELRTPVTSINGVIQTLHSRGDLLEPSQRSVLRETLRDQGRRLGVLVEQLLDLSRLDAEAISIDPQLLQVRERVEELVRSTAGERARDVQVEVPEDLEASVDPAAFDRILGNLVANALRYGEPPVIVRAEQRDRHFRLAVEDRGPGVPPEFVPDLFERFTRSTHRARARRGHRPRPGDRALVRERPQRRAGLRAGVPDGSVLRARAPGRQRPRRRREGSPAPLVSAFSKARSRAAEVRARGLEPPRASGPTGPKPAASASSATPANAQDIRRCGLGVSRQARAEKAAS